MMTVLIGGLLGAVLLHHSALWVLQRRLLFPGAYAPGGAEPARPDVERLSVDHADGQTHGYLLRCDQPSAGLVVYGHGNAEFAADWIFDAQPYTAAGFHFLCLEYRGFGASDGTPSERGMLEDSVALIERVLALPGLDVDAGQVVYHGRSLGGGVLAAVASARPPRRMILESTFSSVASMASRFLAPPYLVRDGLDVAGWLASPSRGPVLLMHSRVDEVIPFRQFELNCAAAGKRAVETVIHGGMGHNDSWLFEDPGRLARFASGE